MVRHVKVKKKNSSELVLVRSQFGAIIELSFYILFLVFCVSFMREKYMGIEAAIPSSSKQTFVP